MLILGLETATAACTVALVEDGQLLSELTVISPRVHSARLLPLVAQAFAEAGRERRELTAVAAGVGPGSFTGLRIGLSAAKTLAFALGVPCVPVGTLAAIAAGVTPVPGIAPGTGGPPAPGIASGTGNTLIAPLLDAKRGDVYTALYRVAPGDIAPRLTEVVAPRLVPLGEWLAQLDQHRAGTPVYLAGDAVPTSAELPLWAMPLPPGLRLPRGWAVAALGAQAVAQGQTIAPEALTALYLRRSEAEILWEQRHGHTANS